MDFKNRDFRHYYKSQYVSPGQNMRNFQFVVDIWASLYYFHISNFGEV